MSASQLGNNVHQNVPAWAAKITVRTKVFSRRSSKGQWPTGTREKDVIVRRQTVKRNIVNASMQGCLALRAVIVTTAIIVTAKEMMRRGKVDWRVRKNLFPPEHRPLAVILNRIY